MTYSVTNLGRLAGDVFSEAFGVATGGAVAVGYSDNNAGTTTAVYWDSSNVIHRMPGVLSSFSQAVAVSADGTKAVGRAGTAPFAALWTGGPNFSTAFTHLGIVVGGVSATALGISSDGTRIVGRARNPGDAVDSRPCVWDAANPSAAPTLLPISSGGQDLTGQQGAYCCNSDGTVIFGLVIDNLGNQFPAKWTGGPTWALTLLNVPVGSTGTENVVHASNSSGSIAVGTVTNAIGDTFGASWSGVSLTEYGSGGAAAIFGSDATGNIFGGIDGDATVWTAGTPTLLGDVPGGLGGGGGLWVSPDAVIVGSTLASDGFFTAVKWASSASSTVATMADLFFANTPSFVDFTQVSNRRKFIAVNGGAQNLQSDGSGPFAVAPPVFLSVQGAYVPADFATNQGRGGAFFQSGPPLSDGASDPPPVTVSTQTVATTVPFSAVLGDYLTGNIYVFNPDTLTDNGTPRKWVRRWRALPGDTTSAITFSYLAIDMETGIQVLIGTNPQIVLRWSDDSGKTWSGNRIVPVGATGATSFTVKFNRLGSTARFGGSTRIFELSSSDPFKVSLISAEVMTK